MNAKNIQGLDPAALGRLTLTELVFGDHQIEEALITSDGEITPEIESMIQLREAALPEKVDKIQFIINRFGALAEAAKDNENLWRTSRQVLERSQERLRDYVKRVMLEAQLKKLHGNMFQFNLKNARPRLFIDERALPEEFKTTILTITPDKAKIEDALKAGLEVPGARFEQSFALTRTVNRGDAK